MLIQVVSIDVAYVGTITSKIQYTIKALTLCPECPNQQVELCIKSTPGETLKDVKVRLVELATDFWANLAVPLTRI